MCRAKDCNTKQFVLPHYRWFQDVGEFRRLPSLPDVDPELVSEPVGPDTWDFHFSLVFHAADKGEDIFEPGQLHQVLNYCDI